MNDAEEAFYNDRGIYTPPYETLKPLDCRPVKQCRNDAGGQGAKEGGSTLSSEFIRQ